MNHWIITKDFINNKLKGIKSCQFPAGLDPETMPVRFQMFDDDNNLYCAGRMLEEDFEPLDDFGMGAMGCTGLKTGKIGKPLTWL